MSGDRTGEGYASLGHQSQSREGSPDGRPRLYDDPNNISRPQLVQYGGSGIHRSGTPTAIHLPDWPSRASSTTYQSLPMIHQTLSGSTVSLLRGTGAASRPLTEQMMYANHEALSPPPFSPHMDPHSSLMSTGTLYDGPPSEIISRGTSPRTTLVNQSRLSLGSFLPSAKSADMLVPPARHHHRSGSSSTAGHGGAGDDGQYEKHTTLPPEAIVKLHDRDDAEISKGIKRIAIKVTPILTFISTAAYLMYLAFRIYCVVDAQNVGGKTYGPAWIFIGVELATWIPAVTHNIWTMMALKRRRRPRLRLATEMLGGSGAMRAGGKGADEVLAPTVDVLITCCGEDDDLVLDTVRAACDLEYPRSQYRVVLLDDGKSEALERGCAALDGTYGNVFYVARPKFPGVPHHFKSGNLNYGLGAVKSMPGGAGEFVAALDADMIPERDWLRAILPHLLVDRRMALACPPQLFYNTPKSDPLAQNLDFFVHVIEPIKDALGVAWCTGSGYVVRRAALDDVGLFPLGSLAEDVATSTLMLGRGWKTAYVHEPLQFGTVPEDYGSHIKQRTRWAIGTVDTSFKLNFCLWGDKVRYMTVPQRFSGFLYSFLSMYSIIFSISLFSIPIILVMGHALIAYVTETQLRWLIRLCFIAVISSRLNEFFLFAPSGYHTGQRGSRYQLWMSPYIAWCLIRAFLLPKFLGGQVKSFKPTGSIASSLQERNPKERRNVFIRLYAILFNYQAFYHLAFVYLTLAGVSLSTYRCISVNRRSNTDDTLMCLVTHAFWPPMTFLFLCTSLWTPISYAIFPPSVPDREQLLVRDPVTGVAHPTSKSKKIAFGGQAAWFELEYTLSTVYTCGIFVASFIY